MNVNVVEVLLLKAERAAAGDGAAQQALVTELRNIDTPELLSGGDAAMRDRWLQALMRLEVDASVQQPELLADYVAMLQHVLALTTAQPVPSLAMVSAVLDAMAPRAATLFIRLDQLLHSLLTQSQQTSIDALVHEFKQIAQLEMHCDQFLSAMTNFCAQSAALASLLFAQPLTTSIFACETQFVGHARAKANIIRSQASFAGLAPLLAALQKHMSASLNNYFAVVDGCFSKQSFGDRRGASDAVVFLEHLFSLCQLSARSDVSDFALMNSCWKLLAAKGTGSSKHSPLLHAILGDVKLCSLVTNIYEFLFQQLENLSQQVQKALRDTTESKESATVYTATLERLHKIERFYLLHCSHFAKAFPLFLISRASRFAAWHTALLAMSGSVTLAPQVATFATAESRRLLTSLAAATIVSVVQQESISPDDRWKLLEAFSDNVSTASCGSAEACIAVWCAVLTSNDLPVSMQERIADPGLPVLFGLLLRATPLLLHSSRCANGEKPPPALVEALTSIMLFALSATVNAAVFRKVEGSFWQLCVHASPFVRQMSSSTWAHVIGALPDDYQRQTVALFAALLQQGHIEVLSETQSDLSDTLAVLFPSLGMPAKASVLTMINLNDLARQAAADRQLSVPLCVSACLLRRLPLAAVGAEDRQRLVDRVLAVALQMVASFPSDVANGNLLNLPRLNVALESLVGLLQYQEANQPSILTGVCNAAACIFSSDNVRGWLGRSATISSNVLALVGCPVVLNSLSSRHLLQILTCCRELWQRGADHRIAIANLLGACGRLQNVAGDVFDAVLNELKSLFHTALASPAAGTSAPTSEAWLLFSHALTMFHRFSAHSRPFQHVMPQLLPAATKTAVLAYLQAFPLKDVSSSLDELELLVSDFAVVPPKGVPSPSDHADQKSDTTDDSEVVQQAAKRLKVEIEGLVQLVERSRAAHGGAFPRFDRDALSTFDSLRAVVAKLPSASDAMSM